jgi:hypothetical protein
MGGTILQPHQLIDELHDFIDDPTQRHFYIGGMIGSQPFKYTIDSILSKNEFQNICVIEGCQDYIGMTKPSPCNNHFFYADIITETKIPDFGNDSGFNHGYLIWNPMKLEYKYHVDFEYVGKFDYMIINDAQLIPMEILNVFTKSYPGKIVVIFDPYESGSEPFIGYPSVVDCLSKLSAINAVARSIYNIPTRSIDKSVKCSVKEAKIQRRSIGKIDGNQYVVDDKWFAMDMWEKQKNQYFRKGQRLWVTDNRIVRFTDLDGRIYTITENALLVVESVPMFSTKLKLRVWNTKFVFESEVSYNSEKEIGKICVKPANVITIDQFRYHKFPNSVFIQSKNIGPRDRYLILKNTNNLVVGV